MKAIMPKSWNYLPETEKKKITAGLKQNYDLWYDEQLAEETKKMNKRAFECVLRLVMLALNEAYGFGQVRIDRLLDVVYQLADEYPDVYGDATFEALQLHLARAGIKINANGDGNIK